MQERNNPAEFPGPGAEFAPPAEEFPPVPAPEGPSGGRRRKSRLLKLAAAAVMLAVLIVPGQRAFSGPAPVPTAIAEPTQAPRVEPTAPTTEEPAPSPTTAPSPTASPTPTPEPTPSPAPEKPEAEIVCMSFSDTLEGSVFFKGTRDILSARVEVWDSVLEIPCGLSYELSREEIDAGRFDLPTIPMDRIYTENRKAYDDAGAWWPEPELRLTWSRRDETGETVEDTMIMPNSYELGWSIRYWGPEVEESEYAAPDTFGLSTYESETPVSIALSDELPAERGAITVSVTVNGVKVTPEMAEVYAFMRDIWGERVDDDSAEGYYYGRVGFRRDPSWPEHGTAHFTVREYLRGFDYVWTAERDLEY